MKEDDDAVAMMKNSGTVMMTEDGIMVVTNGDDGLVAMARDDCTMKMIEDSGKMELKGQMATIGGHIKVFVV